MPASSRKLPLCLGRKALAGPFRISRGIRPGDMNYGIFFLFTKIAVGTFGMSPVCSPLRIFTIQAVDRAALGLMAV